MCLNDGTIEITGDTDSLTERPIHRVGKTDRPDAATMHALYVG